MKKQILLSVMAVSMFALLSASSKQSVDGDQTTKAAIANAKNLPKEGLVINMFPPGNDGSERGAGIVRENDGTNRGAEFVFQTPQDVSDTPLELNTKITFEAEGNDARNVKKATVAEPNIR